jgi:aspartate/glutamate racemase
MNLKLQAIIRFAYTDAAQAKKKAVVPETRAPGHQFLLWKDFYPKALAEKRNLETIGPENPSGSMARRMFQEQAGDTLDNQEKILDILPIAAKAQKAFFRCTEIGRLLKDELQYATSIQRYSGRRCCRMCSVALSSVK